MKKILTLLLLATLTSAVGWGADVTVTKTMNEIVSENNYTVSSGNTAICYTSLALDAKITLSTTGAPNCGSFWGTTTHDWRLYQNKSGNAIVTAIDELERRTGIDFFCNLPDDIENAVESAVDTSFWNIGN